jgi:hypothetical protein
MDADASMASIGVNEKKRGMKNVSLLVQPPAGFGKMLKDVLRLAAKKFIYCA